MHLTKVRSQITFHSEIIWWEIPCSKLRLHNVISSSIKFYNQGFFLKSKGFSIDFVNLSFKSWLQTKRLEWKYSYDYERQASVYVYTQGASKTEKNRWWMAKMTSSLNEEALEELNMKNKLTQHIIQIFERKPHKAGLHKIPTKYLASKQIKPRLWGKL